MEASDLANWYQVIKRLQPHEMKFEEAHTCMYHLLELIPMLYNDGLPPSYFFIQNYLLA